MQRGLDVNPKELAQRAESLIRHSSNRYLTTVRIAFRAKQRRDARILGKKRQAVLRRQIAQLRQHALRPLPLRVHYDADLFHDPQYSAFSGSEIKF